MEDEKTLAIYKERKNVAIFIRKQVEGEATNSHKFDYMRQLAIDLADWYDSQKELFCREIFFSQCGIKEKPYAIEMAKPFYKAKCPKCPDTDAEGCPLN
jgi:hypothetical protein